MPFNSTERFELESLIQSGNQDLVLDKNELDFFTEIGNLRQLRTYMIISPPKRKRTIETAVLIFLLDSNFNLPEIITAVFDFLSPPFRILIDFSFLLEKTTVQDD